jgi:predicted histone-like DNA-binding protein
MTVKYTAVARRKPGDPPEASKYYPNVKSSGRVTLRQLAQSIADISTVSTVDTVAVLEALLKVIPRELANGNIVQLGDFGSFSLRVRGEGAATPEEVTARHITKILATFRPGKLFKATLDNIDFEKM